MKYGYHQYHTVAMNYRSWMEAKNEIIREFCCFLLASQLKNLLAKWQKPLDSILIIWSWICIRTKSFLLLFSKKTNIISKKIYLFIKVIECAIKNPKFLFLWIKIGPVLRNMSTKSKNSCFMHSTVPKENKMDIPIKRLIKKIFIFKLEGYKPLLSLFNFPLRCCW